MRSVYLFAVLSVLSASQAPAQDGPKRITQHEATDACVHKIQPEYPNVARQLKIQGVAELEAEITEDGSVEHVKTVSGSPVLTKAATEAFLKWKFKPFLENGKPVRVVVAMSFTFSL